MTKTRAHKRSFIREHSLSLTSTAVLILWLILYRASDPSTHVGSFFGNAIADWSGLLVMVLATKYLYEKGSVESRRPPPDLMGSLGERLRDHSLTIFLLLTGAAWVGLYSSVGTETKWGQVVDNIVSEWTQIIGLVLMTKVLIERRSKESNR